MENFEIKQEGNFWVWLCKINWLTTICDHIFSSMTHCLLVNLFDKSFQFPLLGTTDFINLLGTTDFLTSDIKSIDLEMTKSVALHQSSMDLPKSKVEILLHVFSNSMNSLLLTTLYHISSRPLITWKERRRNGFKK